MATSKSHNYKIFYTTCLMVLCSVIFNTSCKKDQFVDKGIKVLGHGGMGVSSAYPMNSLESILSCLNLNADGVELDIQMTKDGHLIAYHEVDLDNVTNKFGRVNSLNYSDLKDAYYTIAPYNNYKLMTLEDIFSNIENPNKYIFTLDCKLYPDRSDAQYPSHFVSSLIQIINKFQLDHIIIESQDVNFLKLLQQQNINSQLFYYPGSFEEGFDIITHHNFDGLTISNKNINNIQVAQLKNYGKKVSVWNTHTQKDNLDAMAKEVDYIQTEKVKYLVKVLKN